MSVPSAVIAWVDLRRDAGALADRIVRAMRDPWIASYAVGFGPPLTRLHPKVVSALEGKKAAFEKLATYFQVVFGDLDLQLEVGRKNAEIVRRLHGKDVDPSLESWRALDLELRLHALDTAPAGVADELRKAGFDLVLPREKLESRFLVRLDDPFGAALAHQLELPTTGQLLEHRVWPEAAAMWRAFAERQGVARVIPAP